LPVSVVNRARFLPTQGGFIMMFKFKVFNTTVLALAVAALVGCGGDSEPTRTATGATVVAASPATQGAATTVLRAAATTAAPATFASGVPDFGTTASTTLAISSSDATATTPTGGTVTGPAFSVASGGNTASGVLTFGSCVFTVSASTFGASHPLALGKQVTVNPCQASLATAGVTADGTTKSTDTTLTLGTATSSTVKLSVQVWPSGAVLLVISGGNAVPVGEVTTTAPTGTGGGG
jgi:hypothetical protein